MIDLNDLQLDEYGQPAPLLKNSTFKDLIEKDGCAGLKDATFIYRLNFNLNND